ncbi:cell division protein ZipA [Vreelandella neptunia]|uniref:Cell division protein ZipA n=1 Tax=Vreelandella neptunia TaxID=115551 RepID=A0ABS9S484_9GAMM|nr:cell division protein ZipA [Halomonas neptunia]MCH4810879.1 cell division protein ZipA [Halomonas neptunia]
MELREWLIILGLALVSLIVIDGARRLQRQRRVPRLDQAGQDLSAEDPDEAAKAAEINWELPNGGARVVKPADYSGLGNKPKLERQEHPGPSRVLSEFRRSASAKAAKRKADKTEAIAKSQLKAAEKSAKPVTATAHTATSPSMPTEHERREPSITMANTSRAEVVQTSTTHSTAHKETTQPVTSQTDIAQSESPEQYTDTAVNPTTANARVDAPEPAPAAAMNEAPVTQEAATSTDAFSISASDTDTEAAVQPHLDAEPVLRAEPEDAVFAKHASSDHSPKRRQLRSDTVGEHDELDDDEVDEYRLVDFEGMGRSLKRRLIERRKEKQRKKAEKAVRDKALAKQKAERKALEAEQRREAKEAADAERVRLAQEQAEAREAAANAAAADRLATQQRMADDEARHFELNGHAASEESYYEERYQADFDEGADYATGSADNDRTGDKRATDERVRAHPTLEKALRHDVSGEHAKETLSSAEEVVVISVLSRDPEGFDGSKLLELMMVCGLRYSSEMGIFHRFETESEDSELQFSMVNVVKPGTFPIEEMGEFMTPGITLLMPLPGAVDSSAAFEAMVETAMVLVRHMGGELKDENRSVMTAQTIEFARQRVREFERRHRLHRHMQAR